MASIVGSGRIRSASRRGPTLASMLTSYRRVLAEPGALRFSATGLVARLPISMVGLGIVLLVSARDRLVRRSPAPSRRRTWSPTPACAILQGRLRRPARPGPGARRGQPSVFGVAHGAADRGRSQADWPIAGDLRRRRAGRRRACPRSAPCVRARWSHVLDAARPTCRPRTRSRPWSTRPSSSSARSLVTVLATAWRPGRRPRGRAWSPASAARLAFCAQRATEPPPHPHRPLGRAAAADAVARPWSPLAVVSAALGVLFGAAEVATVAFADEQGDKAYAGGAARPVGARQPGRRRRHRRGRLAARPGGPGAAGARSAWPARWRRCASSARCR